jgi:hypothetical protein
MSQAWMRYAAAGIVLVPLIGVCHAQLPPAHDAWLMQNYRFTGPPPPGEARPAVDPLSEIREVQSTVRFIMRQAEFEWDYEAALAAAAQAVANAQLMGSIIEHRQAVEAARASQASQSAAVAKAAVEETQPPAPLFLIAMKDKTINAAAAYWVDGPMMNYVTQQGVHVIVRLDLVDRGLSRELNRQRNVEFRLPE